MVIILQRLSLAVELDHVDMVKFQNEQSIKIVIYRWNIFNEDLDAAHCLKTKIVMDKQIYVRIAKLCQFHFPCMPQTYFFTMSSVMKSTKTWAWTLKGSISVTAQLWFIQRPTTREN